MLTSIVAVLLLIAMLPTALASVAIATTDGNTQKGVDAMTAIESALSSKKRGATVKVANDGYIGIPVEVSVYHGGGTVKPGYAIDATPIVIYVVNTQIERIGTDSDVNIINSMLDRGFVVVIFDYLNNAKAISPDLDWSVQGLRPNVVKGTYFSGAGLSSGSYHNNMVVPAGYNIEFNQVFFEIDKHGADGIFDKTIEIWNNDFRSYHRNKLVKWVDENGNRKATQKGFDGSDPVWLNSSGTANAGGEYIRVHYTKAEKVEDLVKPDGTPIDWNLYMHITYPTNPGYDVPVMALACSSSHLAGGTQTADRPQLNGFAFGGYATATFDHGFFPMARTDHFDFYSGTVSATGNTGVTNDGGAYCLQHYDNVRIDTAAMRYLRYLSLSDHDKYSFNITSVGVYGNSKGGWATHLGEENPETGIQRRIVPGYNGKSRYENGKTEDIIVGDYVIDGGEVQPWLTYNGEKIDSGADLVYAGCSGGQYTITPEHAPTFISCQLSDGSFYGNSNLMVNACRTSDVPTMWFEVAQGHTLASAPDMRYGVNTYNAFMDFCGYYLRGDAVKVEYVHRDAEKYSGMPNNGPITVKFTGAVSADEARKITLTDSEGKAVTGGIWKAQFGNTEWTLEVPTLECDEAYTLTVPAGITGDNGKGMSEDYTFEFRTGYEIADTGTTLTTAAGTYVYFTVPDPTTIEEFDAELYTIRLYVSNDGINKLTVYPLGNFDPTSPEGAIMGNPITTVPVAGAGQYDIDVTDYIKNMTPGTTAAFLVKQTSATGETLVHSSPLTSNKGSCSVGGNFSASIAEAPDGTKALRIDSMSYKTSYPNNEFYYCPSTVITNSSIIKDGVLRDEDIGRSFRISFKVYDTTSRIITVSMNSITSSSKEFSDYNVSYYNIHTKAGEWVEFSFIHTVYEPLYADTVGYKSQKLTINAPSWGCENPGLYISDIRSVEVITDITVSAAELLIGTTKQRENPLVTEYGTIPTVYESVEDYPYVIFDSTGKCVSAGKSLIDTGVGLLLAFQDNTPPFNQTNHTLLVRRDMEHTSSYANFGFIHGNLTIDLLGNTLTCTGRLLHAQAKRSGTLNVTVKNGTMLQKNTSLIEVSSYDTEHYTYETTGTRTFNFLFENVTLGYVEGASSTPFITTAGASQFPVISNIELKNCTVDLATNAPGGTYQLFKSHNDSNASSHVSIEMTGGTILANKFTGITIGKTQGNGSFKFVSDEKGRYTTVVLPETAAAPSGSYDTDTRTASYIAAYTEDGKTVYRLDINCIHGDVSEGWQSESGTHKRFCSYCRSTVDVGECFGGKANCSSGAICSKCGDVYTAPDTSTHVPSGNWTYENDKHYSTCKNGCGVIEEACSGGTATCKYRAICSTCKNNYGTTLEHRYDDNCDETCNSCKSKRVAPHTFGETWQKNDEFHWQDCIDCGEMLNTSAHSNENGDEACDSCGYPLPATTPEPSPNPNPDTTPDGASVGLIVGVSVGSVAVVGIGVFSLIWFVIKKKSFIELFRK